MSAQSPVTTTSIARVVDRILSSRKISQTDQQALMAALMSENAISTKDKLLIKRVLYALQRGLLRVVD